MKKFLISIDTEGDNLWSWKPNDEISTKNVRFLYRFQDLCDEYGFKPTYLTNYEMAINKDFRSLCNRIINSSSGEIGLHVHAWNNPPEYTLGGVGKNSGAAYITEYPDNVIQQKVRVTYDILADISCMPIKTHRSGRWATNMQYLNILAQTGIKYDCSVTPHIDWSANIGMTEGSCGNDYTFEVEKAHRIELISPIMWEIPVTVRRTRRFFCPQIMTCRSIAESLYRSLSPQNIWLRPTNKNLNEMKWLINKVSCESDTDYIMFMLHSSEFMPGGSPTFRDEEAIEELYRQLNVLFEYARRSFVGMTISEYGDAIRNGV